MIATSTTSLASALAPWNFYPRIADRDFRLSHTPIHTGTDLIVWFDVSAESLTRLVVSPL